MTKSVHGVNEVNSQNKINRTMDSNMRNLEKIHLKNLNAKKKIENEKFNKFVKDNYIDLTKMYNIVLDHKLYITFKKFCLFCFSTR